MSSTIGNRIFDGVAFTLRALCRYHDYEVEGFEHIPATGPALVIFHHSLATYDSFLLGVPVHDRLQRRFVSIADRNVFKTPGLGRVFREMGFVSSSRKDLVAKLKEGELVGIAPGGTRDMLRGEHEKYQFDWSDRSGFIWVSIMSEAPIILAACPRGDDIFEVIDNPVTPLVYDKLRVPLPLFRGRFGLPIPRPVKLWHVLSEPIHPPVRPEDATPDDAERHHLYVIDRMKALMAESIDRFPSKAREP